MRHVASSGVCVTVAVAAVACSGGSRWTGTVTDSAGIAIVANTHEGTWTESEAWTLEEDLRIGAVEGEPEYQFGDIGLIAVDSRARMFVMDVQARHVRVFSPEGVYQQTIGQPGSGPGEFGAQVAALYMGPGDTLLVPDLANQRVNRLWVQHIRPLTEVTEGEAEIYGLAVLDLDSQDWDVFDGAGRYMGVVTMPPRFTPRAMVADKIYGVWQDDLDVQYVMRLRIVGD